MPDISLTQKIIELKQAINLLGSSWLLNYVHPDFIEKMERDTQGGSKLFTNYLEHIKILLTGCTDRYEDYKAFMDLKDKYSEAYILSKLLSVLHVTKVAESGDKSPDFKVVHSGNDIYIEMKSLNMLDSTLKHKVIMESALRLKCDLENQIAEKKKTTQHGNIVVMGHNIIHPYLISNKPYDHRSCKLVIEAVIGKIRNNIHAEQYSYGETLLLINFSDQITLPESPDRSIQKEYIHENANDRIKKKGCLWHIACGDVGTPLPKLDEFDERTEILEKQGILKEYEFIKALVFHIEGKFYALMNDTKPSSIFNMLSYLTYIKFIHNQSFICEPSAINRYRK